MHNDIPTAFKFTIKILKNAINSCKYSVQENLCQEIKVVGILKGLSLNTQSKAYIKIRIRAFLILWSFNFIF